ncbi:MAG TPA: VWA domain-containing protein [Candidatus Binataceae bacterium]|nr:VWA domain-containing protein [Candidatus Binataceae bacterium]
MLIGAATILTIAIVTMASTSLLALQQQIPPTNTLSIPQRQPVALPSITAPSGQPETLLEVPSLKLRTQPGFEQVTVTVTDSDGRYVTNLKEDDFRIFEDGHQRPVGYFRIDRTAPVSIGILIDCSSSMQTKMSQARKAIKAMIDDLDPRDDVFLEAFARHAALIQPFTLDHDKLVDRLKLVHPVAGGADENGTALYDAICMGLFEIRHGIRDKRVLLVVTDGMDNRSTTSRAQAIAIARNMKVLVYAIGIGDQAVNSDEPFFKWVLRPDDNEIDMNVLNELADETGARAFNLHRVGDGEQLSRDCAAISDELRQQYTLAYVSPDPMRLSYRSLKVDVPKHPELSVRVRKGVAIIPPATPPR